MMIVTMVYVLSVLSHWFVHCPLDIAVRARYTLSRRISGGSTRKRAADGEPGERSNASPARVALGPGGQNCCDSVFPFLQDLQYHSAIR